MLPSRAQGELLGPELVEQVPTHRPLCELNQLHDLEISKVQHAANQNCKWLPTTAAPATVNLFLKVLLA